MAKNAVRICLIDEMGRICLPEDIMKRLGIGCDATLRMNIDNGRIVLQKAQNCHICGSEGETRRFMGRDICLDCLASARLQAVASDNRG